MKKINIIITAIIISMLGVLTSSAEEQTARINDFTLMIYMNGSDLESRYQLATKDFGEMMSVIPRGGFEIVILTGGTNVWHSNDIKNDELSVHTLSENGFKTERTLPLQSMGNAETLSAFLNYSVENHPANRYGLIFWDHGDGSLRGFGHDELHENDSLTLSEMTKAFENFEKTFDFIGFDACLMANVEVLALVSPYAKYLVASQELEPGNGWDYDKFLPLIYEKDFDIEEALIKHAEQFTSSENNKNEMKTLSVIKTENIRELEDSISVFGEKINALIETNLFEHILEIRKEIKEFGQPSFVYKGPDMVDIGDLAEKFSMLLPEETKLIKTALENVVVHAAKNEIAGISSGLSVYFPYRNRELMKNIDVYNEIFFSENYKQMATDFTEKMLTPAAEPEEKLEAVKDGAVGDINMALSNVEGISDIYAVLMKKVDDFYINFGYDSDIDIDLESGEINSSFTGEWLMVNSVAVSAFTRSHNEERIIYSAPVLHNGERAELVIVYDDENPEGTVEGIRSVSSGVSGKGYIPLNNNDKITFLYEIVKTEGEESEKEYFQGDTISYDGEFIVDIGLVPDGTYRFGFCVKDVYNNLYYSNFYNYSVRKK